VSAWRVTLEERGLGSSSIIVRMSAIRKLAVEATDNGLLAPELAAGLVPIRSRWPRNFALSEVDDADPSRNSDPDLHQQFDNALVDTPRGRHRYPWESAPDT
jgi:hypothetical protein